MPKANGRAEDLQPQDPALAGSPERAAAEPRRLTRSRSIPSGEHNDGITPLFPGPLLPTVRRLNSSPKVIGYREPAGLKRGDVDSDHATAGNERALEQGNGGLSAGKSRLEAATTSTKHGRYTGEAAPFTSQGSAGGAAAGLAAELREFSKANDELFRVTFDKFDKAKAARETTPSSLLSYDGGLLHKSGIRSWGPRPRADGDGNEHWPMRPAKALRKEAEAAGLKAAEKLQPPEVHGLFSQSARPESSGQQLQLNEQQQRLQSNKSPGPNSRGIRKAGPGIWIPPDTEVEAPQQDTGSSGLRQRRALPGVGLLDLPEEAFEGRRILQSFVNETGRQHPSSGGSRRSPSSSVTPQRQSSYLWNLLSVPLSSKISVLLMLTACVVAMLYAFAMHTEVQILREQLDNLRRTANSCAPCPTLMSSSQLALEVDENENKAIGARRFALYITFLFLLTPFLFFKYVDDFPRLRGMASTSTEEELPLSKQVAYRVDVLFSTHSFAKPVALLLATVLLIGVGGVALFAVSTESLSDTLWLAWSYVADSGNHADSVGFGPRVVSVSISFGGMLVFALMLGLVSDAISEKVDSLRKGKSEVIESNHTLILGWSDKLGSLLKQLAIANQSLGGGVVVVLAERDKEEMESDIAKLEFDFMGTMVICRSGSPLIMADLKKVSVSKARALIVLAEVENADQSDARALRVVLNLTGVKEGLRGHIVVELSDVDNEQLVKLVGGELVETVVAHDVIGRLMIQCARQPGLAQIWEDILGFANAEFYVKRWPELDGMRFEDVLISFPEAIPCGVKVSARDGQIVLNPDDDYVLAEGDELLVLAEDDDTYAPGDLPEVMRESLPPGAVRRKKRPQKILLCGWRRDIDDMIVVRRGALPEIVSGPKLPERILFCGWRRDIDDMIMVLEAFLASGSELWLFSDVPLAERDKRLQDGGLYCDQLVNTRLVHREGNAVIRRHLESLPLETFDSILILADEALEETVVNADSRSLATLLLIRDIQSKRMPYRDKGNVIRGHSGKTQSSWINEMQQASDNSIIISEILDSRTKNLVSVSKISDYVLSNELVSMALAMVAEDKQINRVLEELFAEEGNEMYIRTAEVYLYDQEELSFYDVMIRARQRQEIVIGYRKASSEKAIINPPDKATRVKWSVSDVFIVLAEEE